MSKKTCCSSDFLSLSKKILLCLLLIQPLQSTANDVEFFGTINTHVGFVSPGTTENKDYVGLRDAYTRLALKWSHQFANDVTAFGLVELPFDTANLKVQHTWDQNADVFDSDAKERLAKLQLSSPKYGTVWVGRDWEPYYLAISSVVDRYSSFYTGFATYSALRVDQALTYSMPTFNGIDASFMYSKDNGDKKNHGGADNRRQAAISYSTDGTKLAFGFTDVGGVNDRQFFGVSFSKQIGRFYVGTKYERNKSRASDKTVFGHDGARVVNLYVEYKNERHTFKSHLANIDNFGDDIFHLGYDYQLNKSTKIFAEYYSEQTGAAISSERDGFRDTYWAEGGTAFLIGVSFQFNKKLF